MTRAPSLRAILRVAASSETVHVTAPLVSFRKLSAASAGIESGAGGRAGAGFLLGALRARACFLAIVGQRR